MSLAVRHWGTAVAAVAGVCAAGTHLPASEEPAAGGEAFVREISSGGVVARVPFVGTLAWRCDREGRFSSRLIHPAPGASITVSLESDGAHVWRRRRVDPAPAPRETVVGPFHADRNQVWTIRYSHKPATLKVVARSDIRVRRIAH